LGGSLRSSQEKKRITLELGGNAGVIIEPDADIDRAVERCAMGGYVYAGQVCISVQRIYIQESIYDEFTARFVEKVKALKPETLSIQRLILDRLLVHRTLRACMSG